MRFGRNVASYKFALGQALLELGVRQQTFVRLEDLAVPYAAAICEHLRVEDRQSTSAQSQFLDACRSCNRDELDATQLAEVTVRLGFANVIDAFHISRGGQPTQTRFFADERASRQGITLTDHLLELANGQQSAVLPREVDARWNLVQMSWGLHLGARLVSFEMAPDEDAVDLYAPARLRRGPIAGVRDALSGYQDGRCAYCQSQFTDIGTSRVAVDHCSRSCSCPEAGKTVTSTRSGISSWPATRVTPPNATARPPRTGCHGWNSVASTSSPHTIPCARP